MLQYLFLALLVYLAIRTTGILGRERSVFAEFHQTTAMRWCVWLLPLTYALPLVWRICWRLFFPAPIGVVLLLPPMVLAFRIRRHFEKCGTDRTKRAEETLGRVLTFGGMALAGLLIPAAIYWLTPPPLRRHLAFF